MTTHTDIGDTYISKLGTAYFHSKGFVEIDDMDCLLSRIRHRFDYHIVLSVFVHCIVKRTLFAAIDT